MATIKEALLSAGEILAESNIESARTDAALLLSYVIDKDGLFVRVHEDEPISNADYDIFMSLVSLRAKYMPVAYIVRNKEFYGLDFYVDENVLIPRPETELVAKKAIDTALEHGGKTVNVLDMCCGSGCIGVSVLMNAENTFLTFADISEGALAVAAKNANRYNLGGRYKTVHTDLFSALPDERYDIIAANPPYISEREMKSLSKDILSYEPHIALLAPQEGLYYYKNIIAQAKNHLAAGGCLLMEIGCTQKEEIGKMLAAEGYSSIETQKDLAGLDRTVFSVYGGEK